MRILAFSEIHKEMPNLKLYIGGPVYENEKRYSMALNELVHKQRGNHSVVTGTDFRVGKQKQKAKQRKH